MPDWVLEFKLPGNLSFIANRFWIFLSKTSFFNKKKHLQQKPSQNSIVVKINQLKSKSWIIRQLPAARTVN
jgi:hypothetical protein